MVEKNFRINAAKVMAGLLVAGVTVATPVTNVYAYTASCSTTNQLGVKCDTIEVKTLEEAKALEAELRKDGIKANLTLNCYGQDVENYLKTNLANIPVAGLYECVKLVQKGSCPQQPSSTKHPAINPNCPNKKEENKTQGCNKDANKKEENKTQGCNKDANKKEENKTSGCQTAEKKEENTATVEPTTGANSAATTTETTVDATTDVSPKTGDSVNILMLGGGMLISMLGFVAVYLKKRKHV